MRRLLLSLPFLAAFFYAAPPLPAGAACPAIPYVFNDGTSTVSASTTNGNNNSLRGCATNVDNTQIGTAGIFASQIIPTTGAQATFGGTQLFTFPAGISATTGVFSSSLTVNGNIYAYQNATTGQIVFGSTTATQGDLYYNGSNYAFYNPGVTTQVAQINATTGTYAVGSSSYGPTSATVNGPISGTTGTFTAPSAALILGTAGSQNSNIKMYNAGGYTDIFSNTATAVSTVTANILGLDNGTTNLFAFATSGNFGLTGSVYTGSSVYGPTSAVVNGSVTASSYITSSDRRYKKDIHTVPYGLDAVAKLKPSAFVWKSSGKHDLGFIAQDVKRVLPELVTANNKGYLGVNYSGIMPVLTRAIQQQQAEIVRLVLYVVLALGFSIVSLIVAIIALVRARRCGSV